MEEEKETQTTNSETDISDENKEAPPQAETEDNTNATAAAQAGDEVSDVEPTGTAETGETEEIVDSTAAAPADEDSNDIEPTETAEAGKTEETADSTAAVEVSETDEMGETTEAAEVVEAVEEVEAAEEVEAVNEVEAVEETAEAGEQEMEEEEEEGEEDSEDSETVPAEEEPEVQEEDEFVALMKEYDLKAAGAESRITGKIIDIIDDKVIVDIGQKTEGILNKDELYGWDGKLEYDVGDSITVICKNINMKQGYITVSKKQVDVSEGWHKVRRSYERKEPLSGRIVSLTEDGKGYKVDMGVEVFLPMSQVDIKKVKSPKNLLGKEYEFKVTRLNSREKTGVVSRRVILEEEREEKIKELFDSLQTGDMVKGTVTSLTDYGAFVNIGGMDGLIHKDNISYGRVNHPKEKLRKGDEVEAMILDMDRENNRISLGLKQKYQDPWKNISEKYPVGKKLIAKVTKIVSFGAFIELEEGVEGLLHISDLTWEGKTNSVEEFVAVGERLWVQVIELHPGEKKIKLGLKQLEMRPEEKYIQKHKSGEIVRGLVKKILKSRVFVELEKGVEGVIKISDISYFRIDSPHEFLKEKETIDVMILSETLDSNYKVKLGLKQLSDDEWRQFINQHKHGSIVKVKVKKVTENGMSVEISKNIEGFIRPNEIDEKKPDMEEAVKNFKPGDEIDALILNSDYDRKRIYLSVRAVRRKKEREEIDKYSKADNEPITTIGDLFESAIDKKK
jgi:small subunit ribosomal protein S1